MKKLIVSLCFGLVSIFLIASCGQNQTTPLKKTTYVPPRAPVSDPKGAADKDNYTPPGESAND